MNIDTDLALTIAVGILAASLIKHIVVVSFSQVFGGIATSSKQQGSAKG